MNSLSARAVWSACYLAVFGAILWYRLLVPLIANHRHRLRAQSVVLEGPDVVSVVIAGRNLEALQARSGQFFRLRFLTRELWWASNPYSLSATVLPGRMRFTVKALGDHSAALAHLRPGTRVFAEGPYGAMTEQRRRKSKMLLIAGGIGITPLRAMLQTMPAGPGEITLIYRVGEADELILQRELGALAQRRGARLLFVVGHRRDLGYDPLCAMSLRSMIADLPAHDVFICGSQAMADAVKAALRQARVPARQIHHESFEF